MITKIVPKYFIKSVHQVDGLFGEHTFNVLKDVGISENEIKNLIESGAIPAIVPINLK